MWTYKVWKMRLLTYMQSYQHKHLRLTKNQVNMTLSKETNKIPIIDSKEMEIYELFDTEVRMILLKKNTQATKLN